MANTKDASQDASTITTTFLIIGAGPAGASLAVFLASYGLKGIIVAAATGTSLEPRAHITNPAAQECLQDVGLMPEVLENATSGEVLQHTRWSRSMVGAEYGRLYAWGNDPRRAGDYAATSPFKHVDLPQTLLEPILIRKAIAGGWTVRYETEFVAFERVTAEEGKSNIKSTVRDKLTGHTYTIASRYLFGCDGARSQVMRQLALPLHRAPGQGLAYNVLVQADLSAYMKHRTGNLHWIFTPELEQPPWGWLGIARMVKPWTEWTFGVLPEPGYTGSDPQPSHAEYATRIKQFIGDDSIPVKVLDVSKWNINEIVAERYSDGKIFCLGDAVHRHPPLNGLGSNTCIQDAWNLAWKIAFVEKGIAGPNLLETYSAERQPIGAGIVARANQAFRDQHAFFEAIGVLPTDVEERKKQHAELSAPTKAGRERRDRLQKAISACESEYSGIGIEMNQRYSSSAIDFRSETGPAPAPPENPVLEHQISSYPGFRLPHAWLNKRVPSEPISTIDLAGHGAFCLLTGIGGEKWRVAAQAISKVSGIPINVYSIGWMQDWEDVYGDWALRREVEEDGCILVRPDRTICWRSMTMQEKCEEVLSYTLGTVLGRKISV